MVLGIAAAVAAGVLLRLADPLSSPVIPAEDPYTHMALVREHLRDGTLDPLNEGGTMYPPGLHALLAAITAYTGLELYDVVRVGPAVMGAVGILGLGILLGRNIGPVAGFVGAMALAVAPEAISRTSMMSPTALDLAVIPFLLLALVEVLRGRLGWLAAAVPLALLLVFSHPWVFGILAGAGAAFLVLWLLAPWSTTRAPAATAAGLASVIAVVGLGFGFSLSGCGGQCGPGFEELSESPWVDEMRMLAPVVIILSMAPATLVAFVPRSRAWLVPKPRARPRHLALRFMSSIMLATALAFVTMTALKSGMPELVDLPRMVGRPILVLAALGFVLLPFNSNATANLGASLAAVTYPFVVHNPLHSEFWPHRTAVYLLLGLAILAGVAGAALARASVIVAHGLANRMRTRGPTRQGVGYGGALMTAPALLVGLSLGGGVYAESPDLYSPSWYRLFTECEMDALQGLADTANADPDAIFVTGDWQSKLVLAALADDASRIWYKPYFFVSPDEREDDLAVAAKEGRPMYVVVDGYMRIENPEADASFLQSAPWEPVGSYCANMGLEQPRMSVYHAGVAK